MGLSVWKLLSSVLIVLALFDTVSALMCYQCNSSREYTCKEMFDHDDDNPLAATNCELSEAKYCIKTTGIWGGIAGTHRFCSAKDLGDQCQYIIYPDHDRVYQACVYTCTSDNCNGSPSHPALLALPIVLITTLMIFILR